MLGKSELPRILGHWCALDFLFFPSVDHHALSGFNPYKEIYGMRVLYGQWNLRNVQRPNHSYIDDTILN
jgi:hypothetical protein